MADAQPTSDHRSPDGQDERRDGTQDGGGDNTPVPAQQAVLQQSEGPKEEIEHPTKLLRLAHMIRSMLDEVQHTELDEAGRRRLADINERTVSQLQEVMSENLGEELVELSAPLHGDDTPSGSELRVVQAQLAGWLEGLFRGIQASMATQQMAAQHQLEQLRRQQQQQEIDTRSRSGTYL